MALFGLVRANNLSDVVDRERAWDNIGGKINLDPLPIDPNYPDVSLLLHGDVLNGGTTIIDSSSSPKTATIFGSARISTASSQFGGASLVAGSSPDFTWGNNRIQFPPGPDFAYGTNDFTLEYWILPFAEGLGRILYTQATGGTNYFMSGVSSANQPFFVFALSGGGTGVLGPAVSVGTWSHIAVVRYNGVARVYTNGVSGTPVNCSQNFSNITYPPNIGGYSHAPSTEPYRGYIDEFRITKNFARYNANFTRPTLPFYDPINTSTTLKINGRDILALEGVRNVSTRDFVFIKSLSSPAQPRLTSAAASAASAASLRDNALLRASPVSTGDYTISGFFLDAASLRINNVSVASIATTPFSGSTATTSLLISSFLAPANFRFTQAMTSGTVLTGDRAIPIEGNDLILYAKAGQN